MIRKINIDLVAILVGRLLQIVVSILIIKFTTSVLSASQMGSIYIFTVIISFYLLFFLNPITQYYFRFMNSWKEKESLNDKIFLVITYSLIVSFISLIISPIIYNFGIANSLDLGILMSLVFFMIFFQNLNQFLMTIINMLHHNVLYVVLSTSTILFLLVFGYVVMKILGYEVHFWLSGVMISYATFGLISLYIVRKKIKDKLSNIGSIFSIFTKRKVKEIYIFAIPLCIATLFMWIQNSGYRLIIEQNIGLEFLGFFGVGIAVSNQIASIVESIALQYLYPSYYKNISSQNINNRKSAIDELINKALPIYFMLTIFLTFLSKDVVQILVDEKFHDAYIYAVIGIWVEFFRMTTNLLGNVSQSEMNTKKFMIPYIIGSVLTTILVYISTMYEDYKLYVPLALIIGGFFTMFIMHLSMRKLISYSINYKILIYSLIISLPYLSIYFIDRDSILMSFLCVSIYGLYFLMTILYIFKKGTM